jgi:hypothetical protein
MDECYNERMLQLTMLLERMLQRTVFINKIGFYNECGGILFITESSIIIFSREICTPKSWYLYVNLLSLSSKQSKNSAGYLCHLSILVKMQLN